MLEVLDGGRFPCSDYINCDIQNSYYEGYTTSVEVTNLFVYNFKGDLIHAALNFPGSWHDSRVAHFSGLIYPKLYDDELTPKGMAVLCDSSFTAGKDIDGKLIRARKSNEVDDGCKSVELCAIDLILQKVMPSERQSAECGICAVKAPFGRLGLPLSSNSETKNTILTVCVNLLNVRTTRVVLSQIRTTYFGDGELCQPLIVNDTI